MEPEEFNPFTQDELRFAQKRSMWTYQMSLGISSKSLAELVIDAANTSIGHEKLYPDLSDPIDGVEVLRSEGVARALSFLLHDQN